MVPNTAQILTIDIIKKKKEEVDIIQWDNFFLAKIIPIF